MTNLTVDVADNSPDTINVGLTFDAGTADGGPAGFAPVLVDLRFPIGVLFPTREGAVSAPRPANRRQFA